jgi:hypothetical protein
MIRTICHGLLLSGLILSTFAQAALPDNIQLQRETLRSLTLIIQLQAEGIQSHQRRELQQDMQQLQQLLRKTGYTDSDYPKSLALTLDALDGGQQPAGEDLDQLHEQALRLLDNSYSADTDTPYLPLLMTEYLAMRYAVSSYIGIPSTGAREQDRYYTTNTNDLLLQLDQKLASILIARNDSSLSARWTMLNHALSDTHDGWTRTRSGKAFTPIMVLRNARVFSNQLGPLLGNPGAVSSQ